MGCFLHPIKQTVLTEVHMMQSTTLFRGGSCSCTGMASVVMGG